MTVLNEALTCVLASDAIDPPGRARIDRFGRFEGPTGGVTHVRRSRLGAADSLAARIQTLGRRARECEVVAFKEADDEVPLLCGFE